MYEMFKNDFYCLYINAAKVNALVNNLFNVLINDVSVIIDSFRQSSINFVCIFLTSSKLFAFFNLASKLV